MSRLLISAAHRSSGKTTVTLGLCAALRERGRVVQAFKKGPDYIDPMWLALASGRDCFNLDPILMREEQIQACFARHARVADISLVEGNMGLHDGLSLDGCDSSAALAQQLGLPVLLVIDARGMTRGVAPLLLGAQAFEPRIRIAGVILNQVGGSRHEAKLRAAIETYTDIPVLGAVAADPRLAVVERHLGLMPCRELDDASQKVGEIGHIIAGQIDLDKVLQIASEAQALPTPAAKSRPGARKPGAEQGVRIGLARDKAFGFYYPDDLLALQAAGAELVAFDCLRDAKLPEVDGLFIGGGFPEMFPAELQANASMRESIRAAIEAGLPAYAECGGLMYLARSLRNAQGTFEMVGAIGADVVMQERPVGRGYVELQSTDDLPWPVAGKERGAGVKLRGHEFHYSRLENIDPDLRFAYQVQRGHGADGQRDGIVQRNLLASYSHLRSGAGSDWVCGFIDFVRSQRTASAQAKRSDRFLLVNGQRVATDVEGYLLNRDAWSEEFARAQAQSEGLQLSEDHWQIIRFLRAHFEEHQVQAQVRVMIRHFAKVWGAERGNNHYLHELFPVGGPQKQGNRLAGLLKTKGEH